MTRAPSTLFITRRSLAFGAVAVAVAALLACDTSLEEPALTDDSAAETDAVGPTGGDACVGDETCAPDEDCVRGICSPRPGCPRGCEETCEVLGHERVFARPLGTGSLFECTVADGEVCALVETDSGAGIVGAAPCDERGSGCLLAFTPPSSFFFRCEPGIGRCTGTEACDGTDADVLTIGCDTGRILGVGCSGETIFPNLTERSWCDPEAGCVSGRNGPCFGDLFVCEAGLRCTGPTSSGTCRVTPVDLSLYGLCRAQSDCEDEAICIISPENETGFCAPICISDNNCGPPPGMTSTCTVVPDSVDNVCLINCPGGSGCPRDMVCVDQIEVCIPVR